MFLFANFRIIKLIENKSRRHLSQLGYIETIDKRKKLFERNLDLLRARVQPLDLVGFPELNRISIAETATE